MPYIDTRLGPGLADLTYTIGREFLGGRQREEAQRQRDLMDLMRKMQETSTPTYRDETYQEPTGQYQPGPALGSSLANQMDWAPRSPDAPPRQLGAPYSPDRPERGGYTPMRPATTADAMAATTAEARQRDQVPDFPGAASPSDRSGQLAVAPDVQPVMATKTRQVLGPPTITPGVSLAEGIIGNPRLLDYFKANPELAKIIQADAERKQWTAFTGAGDTGRAVSPPPAGVLPTQAVGVAPVGTPGAAPSVATGTAQALPEQDAYNAATARRKALQPRIDWINADPTGQRAALPQAKGFQDQFEKAVQDERETATALRQAQEIQRKAQEPPSSEFAADYARARDELRTKLQREPTPTEIGVRVREIGTKAAAPTEIGAVYAMADKQLRNELGRDPTPGELGERVVQLRAKAEATKAPTEFGAAVAQAHEELLRELGRAPTEGELGARALKIREDIKLESRIRSAEEYDTIADTGIDPRKGLPAPPDLVAAAKKSVAGRQARGVERAAATVPKPTTESEKEYQKHYTQSLALDSAAKAVAAHPEFVQGFNATKWAAAYDSPDLVKGSAAWAAGMPRGYAEFRANLDSFTATRLNELAGSALTAGEVKRYAAFLPSVYQPPDRFLANLRMSQDMLKAAMTFHEARAQGATFQQAREAVIRALDAVVASAEAPPGTGKPIPSPAVGNFWGKKNQ